MREDPRSLWPGAVWGSHKGGFQVLGFQQAEGGLYIPQRRCRRPAGCRQWWRSLWSWQRGFQRVSCLPSRAGSVEEPQSANGKDVKQAALVRLARALGAYPLHLGVSRSQRGLGTPGEETAGWGEDQSLYLAEPLWTSASAQLCGRTPSPSCGPDNAPLCQVPPTSRHPAKPLTHITYNLLGKKWSSPHSRRAEGQRGSKNYLCSCKRPEADVTPSLTFSEAMGVAREKGTGAFDGMFSSGHVGKPVAIRLFIQ